MTPADHHPDHVAPTRGCLHGLAIGLALWLAALALVFLVVVLIQAAR